LLVSDDPVVKENATEAINFHLNVWFYSIVIGVLTVITLGLAGFILVPIRLSGALGTDNNGYPPGFAKS
jgi:hypothetical protein